MSLIIVRIKQKIKCPSFFSYLKELVLNIRTNPRASMEYIMSKINYISLSVKNQPVVFMFMIKKKKRCDHFKYISKWEYLIFAILTKGNIFCQFSFACMKDSHSQWRLLLMERTWAYNSNYSRTSVARTLMARLPRLFRTRS